MSALCKRIVITVQLILASALTAHATPSPGIVISDHIIGTTPTSFFVIRTTTLHAPTYYQHYKRFDFVELSIQDGSIVQKCALRETEYASDAGVDRETWTQTEKRMPSCQVFEVLSKNSAGYMTPRGTDTGNAAFRLSAGGLEARRDTSDDSVEWTNIMPARLVKARALKTTSIAASDIPWQTGLDSSEALSLVGTADDIQPLHEMCELDPVPVTSRGHDWMFLRLSCWPGDTDSDGANFYIALTSKR